MTRQILFAFLFGVLFLGSCSEEKTIKEIPQGNATLLFRVNIPMVSLPTITTTSRGGTVDNPTQYENTIQNILVLLFRNNRVAKIMNGIDLTSSATSANFKITTRASSDPVKFYLIANTTYTVDNLGKRLYGKSPTEVRKAIGDVTTVVNRHGVASPFTFWGEIDMPSGLLATSPTTPTQVNGIKMLRAVGRAVIVKSVDDATFLPTSAYIYRMNDRFRPIPAFVSNNNQVTIPSLSLNTAPLPPVSGLEVSSLPLTYYLSESAAATSLETSIKTATCLVIGGKFGGSPIDTYYRIDFEKDTDGNGTVDKVGEILRNHSYSFNIQSVTSPGWQTPDDAANNRPSGLIVQVQDWDDVSSESFQNNEYYFTTTSREITVSGSIGSSNYIDITTNVSDFKLQWDTTSPVNASLIENTNFKVEKVAVTANQYRLIITAKTKNEIRQDRLASFLITANNMKVTMGIRQKVPVKLLPEKTFMWIASDGSHPQINPISSSHGWRIDSKDSWIKTSIDVTNNLLIVSGQPNHNVQNEYRTGTIKLINDADVTTYITVKQVRWVEWTKSYLKGGNCFTTPNRQFVAGFDGKAYYVFSSAGTPLGLSAISGDVYGILGWEVGKPQPAHYAMAGDFYTYPQADNACNSLVHKGEKWKLPSKDEFTDYILRYNLTANKTRVLTDPDGTINYIPGTHFIYSPGLNGQIRMWIKTPVAIPNGTWPAAYYMDERDRVVVWTQSTPFSCRCVRDYR